MTKNSCPNCSKATKTTSRASASKRTTGTSACLSKATSSTTARRTTSKAKLLEPKTKSTTSRKVTTKSCN